MTQIALPDANQAVPLNPILLEPAPDLAGELPEGVVHEQIYALFLATRKKLPCISTPAPDSITIRYSPLAHQPNQRDVILIPPHITAETNLENYTQEEKRTLINHLRAQMLNNESSHLTDQLAKTAAGTVLGTFISVGLLVGILSTSLTAPAVIGISGGGTLLLIGSPFTMAFFHYNRARSIQDAMSELNGFSLRKTDQIWNNAFNGELSSSEDVMDHSCSSGSDSDLPLMEV